MSTITPPTTNWLVNFYDPSVKGKDANNRTLAQMLAWTDDKLESRHDYIQILFPLPEGSPFNPSAPIINREVFNAFRSRSVLRDNLRKSLDRMLHFYGFKFETDGSVVLGAHYQAAFQNWVKRFNHNHLRITRIIRSLRVLGLEGEAASFFKALESVYERSGRISEKSLMFWTRAAKRELFLAPEDDEDRGKGADFLYELESRKKDGGKA